MKKRLPELVRDFDQAPADRLSRFPREPDLVIHGCYRDRGTDKIDLCTIAAELREAVNELRPANGSN